MLGDQVVDNDMNPVDDDLLDRLSKDESDGDVDVEEDLEFPIIRVSKLEKRALREP